MPIFLCHFAANTAEPRISDEITEIDWFAPDDLSQPLLQKYRERLLDATEDRREAGVKMQMTSNEEDQGISTRS